MAAGAGMLSVSLSGCGVQTEALVLDTQLFSNSASAFNCSMQRSAECFTNGVKRRNGDLTLQYGLGSMIVEDRRLGVREVVPSVFVSLNYY